MVKQFPADYMHNVLLGVMRKLLRLWWKHVGFKLTTEVKQLLHDLIELCRQYVPTEFNRKPRQFKDIDRWKATELRLFLLYTGVFLMKDILPKDRYRHFLRLSFAIRILCDVNDAKDPGMIKKANVQLHKFVTDFKKLYPTCNITYNIHSLLHICDDVTIYGNLDSYSAFKFENYLQMIKKKVRCFWFTLVYISLDIGIRGQL